MPNVAKLFGRGVRGGPESIRPVTRSLRTLLKLPFRTRRALVRLERRVTRELFPQEGTAVLHGSWDADALLRVLDSTSSEHIREALTKSHNGRVAVNGLTVTLTQSLGSLLAGIALAEASTTVMFNAALKMTEVRDDLEESVEALLRLDVNPILTAIARVREEVPREVEKLLLSSAIALESLSGMIERFKSITTEVDPSSEAGALIRNAIAEARSLSETIERIGEPDGPRTRR